MKKLFFIALLALITFGCRTVKQTSQTKDEVKTAANLDIKQSVTNQLKVDSSRITVDKSITNSLISEVVTITNLSKPDSIGKQYPIQTTVINRITDNKKVGDLKTESKINSTNENKTTLSDKSDFKSDSIATQKSKITEEIKTPPWVYVVVLVLILALLIFLYTVLKRNGIIK